MFHLIDQRGQVILDGDSVRDFAFMLDNPDTKPSELEQALRNRGYEVRKVCTGQK